MRRFGLHHIIFAALSLAPFGSNAQVVLNADGPGNTYELINSVLAPGYDVVETPECVHGSFGRHITEVFDSELNKYVFEFFAHVTPDNDRCINFDRQRTEIKTYDKSPANLIGTRDELVTYKWRFKVPVGFQPSSSFTHIHQVKPVNGDDGNPLFTLTLRKGTPNKLELIHVISETSGSDKLRTVNLSLFEGVWVEATEQILVGANGSYAISLNRVSDGLNLLNYSTANILTIRADNSFIRPKWGIYRSLNTPADLRDESILFADFSIAEGGTVVPLQFTEMKATLAPLGVVLQWQCPNTTTADQFIIERSADGQHFARITSVKATGATIQSWTDEQPLNTKSFYRVVLLQPGGTKVMSKQVTVHFARNNGNILNVFPNPVHHHLQLFMNITAAPLNFQLYNAMGQEVVAGQGNVTEVTHALNKQVPAMMKGIYRLTIREGRNIFTTVFLKE